MKQVAAAVNIMLSAVPDLIEVTESCQCRESNVGCFLSFFTDYTHNCVLTDMSAVQELCYCCDQLFNITAASASCVAGWAGPCSHPA